MIKLELPELGMGILTAQVVVWHKAPGDEIRFGDVICEVDAAQRRDRDRDKDARTVLLSGRGGPPAASFRRKLIRRIKAVRRRLRSRKRRNDRRRGWAFRIIASEPVTLYEIVAAPGAVIGSGQMMGWVVYPGQDSTNADLSMRVVSELIDRTEGSRNDAEA